MATKSKKTTGQKRLGGRREANESHQRGSDKRWVSRVTTVSTFPPEGIFTKDAESIARSLSSKKVSPKGIGSGIKMVQYFINRGGKGLSKGRLHELERAKQIMQAKLRSQNAKRKAGSKS